MEKFKEEAYFKSYNELIRFEKPTTSELLSFEKHLSDLKIPYDKLFMALRGQLSHNKSVSDLDTTVGIRNALCDLDLNKQPEAIMIWRYPDEVDKFDLSYLLNHWEDVWYPPSDEAVCLYFPLIDRLVMLTDYGNIYY